MNGLFDQITEAANALHQRWPQTPRVGLILGTGLGGVASLIDADATVPYTEIPHFTVSTVLSHAGRLICGRLRGTPLLAMEGRLHSYEGYSMQQVTFPVRVMKALGVEILIVTNAAGGMNPRYALADVVILEDHINLMPDNPLRGTNDDRLGPRFPDMFAPYDPRLIDLAERTAQELGIPAHKGVLVGVPGPNLETRAEYRMLRALGGDVVSMSTVPEVIVAVHAGLRTLGFSIVTDLCTPDALEPVVIDRILETAARGGAHLERLIPAIVERLGDARPAAPR